MPDKIKAAITDELLCVAIPAYKRPDLLNAALDSIYNSRLRSHPVIIVDDSTVYANKKVAESWGDRLTIDYYHNTTNLGIDRNIKSCFDRSCGRYTLVIGEDDKVSPAGVDSMLSILQRDEFDIVWVGYQYYSDDFSKEMSENLLEGLDPERRKSVAAYWYRFGFIGSFVIRTQTWRALSPVHPLGTYFHHLCVLGDAYFSRKAKAQVCKDVVVWNRSESANSASWVKSSLDVHFGYYQAVEAFERYLAPQELEILHKHSKVLFRPHSMLWLIAKRGDGAFELADIERHYASSSNWFKAFLFLLACVPPPLAGVAKNAGRFLLARFS